MLRLGDRAIVGRCAGIALDGGLLLETDGGRETFYSGTLEQGSGVRGQGPGEVVRETTN